MLKRLLCYSPEHCFESIPLADLLQAEMKLRDKNEFVGTDQEDTLFQGRYCIKKV